MAMYMSGDSPVINTRNTATTNTSNGKKTKNVFSRGKGNEGETLIKTCLTKQRSNSSTEYHGERVRLNISGLLYETRLKTLKRYPTTLLGNEETREAYYDEVAGEYFFDRDRQTFGSIMRFYQSGGILMKPSTVPEGGDLGKRYKKGWETLTQNYGEVTHYTTVEQLQKKYLEQVQDMFYRELAFYKLDQFLHKPEDDAIAEKERYESKMPKGRRMRTVWRLMEEPASSIGAKIISILSVTVIFLSIWSFCIETLPSSKQLLRDVCIPINRTGHDIPEAMAMVQFAFWPEYYNQSNTTMKTPNDPTTYARTESPTTTVKPPCRVDMWRYPFFVIETFCVICFTVELLVRFIATPYKVAFMKNPLNIIDIAAILPYFIQLGVDIHTGSQEVSGSEDSLSSLVVLRVLRLVRILRVFKLSRYSTKLRVLGRTLIASVGELSILVFFIFLAMILFSTVVYFIESGSGPGNKFDSIPASFWWAVVTMTTVGYGDVVPRTVLGKIVGFLCAITGVLCIALPVPSIVNNFVKQLEEAENPTKRGRKKKKKARRSVIDRIKTVDPGEGENNHVTVTVNEYK